MLLRTLRGPQNRELQFSLPSRGVAMQSLTGPLRVDGEQVLSLPTAFRCVNLISDSIAGLPVHAYRDDERIDTPPLLEQPEPGFTRMETVSAMVTSLLLHGNAYALVADRNYLGYPTSIVLLSPHAVMVNQDRAGNVTYKVAGVEYGPDDVMHVRGLTLPGQLTGLGVIGYQRRLIGQSIAAEDFSSQLWTTGAIPDGVLQTDADLSPAEADEFKRRWTEKMGGRQRSPAVLSGGMTYKPISFSNVDLEWLESRKWGAVSVSQAFGVPAVFSMVPSSDSKTYQNHQQDMEAFVKGTLRGWVIRLEETFSTFLPRGQHAEFNFDALLRADTKERYEAHAVGLAAGFLTVDEVRELERRPPMPTQPTPPALDPEAPDDE